MKFKIGDRVMVLIDFFDIDDILGTITSCHKGNNKFKTNYYAIDFGFDDKEDIDTWQEAEITLPIKYIEILP